MKRNRTLKLLRVKLGYTQEEMAEKIGISRQNYARYEVEGVKGNVSFWIKVQKAFNLSGEEMWELINDQTEERAQV